MREGLGVTLMEEDAGNKEIFGFVNVQLTHFFIQRQLENSSAKYKEIFEFAVNKQFVDILRWMEQSWSEEEDTANQKSFLG